MTFALPKFRVGDPIRHEALSVFPLFCDLAGAIEYRIAEEALAGGAATIEEVNEAGSVPELLVDNRSDMRLLLLEGEELRGAKQNRILNTSVLVAAHSKLNVPVSCVEQGRWRYTERHFQSSGHHVTSKLRRAVKSSVLASLKSHGGHRADQGKVWEEVELLNSCMAVDSSTSAMSDAFDTYEDQICRLSPAARLRGGRVWLGRSHRRARCECGLLRQADHVRAGVESAAVGHGVRRDRIGAQ
jgi:hypothetical protein